VVKVKALTSFYRILHPRPTALIVSMDEENRPNVMACSWLSPASMEPPMVLVLLGEQSYTRSLIVECGEFTVNIPSRRQMKLVKVAGTRTGRETDKFKTVKATLKPGRKVRVPVIEECPANIECKVKGTFEAGECLAILGEVLDAYADREAFQKGLWKVKVPLHVWGSWFAYAGKPVKEW